MDQLMIGSYLKDEAFVCPYCVARVDYWPTLLGLVKTDVFSTALISLIGGYTSIFTITLEKGKYQYLTLSDYGIPKGAQVYRIFFTVVADGSTKAALHPGAAYSNPLPEQAIPATLLLWPTPVPYGQESLDRNEVNVLVTWAPPSGEDDTKQMLVDALFAVGRKEPSGCCYLVQRVSGDDVVSPAGVHIGSDSGPTKGQEFLARCRNCFLSTECGPAIDVA